MRNPGSPLPKDKTEFIFTTDSCPAPGYYTITNSFFRCPASRIGRSIDHTPSSNYGYTMYVRDSTSPFNKIVYVDTLRENLCTGTSYQFSAWLINTETYPFCPSSDVHFPRFFFRVETTSGQILQAFNTPPMPYDYDPPFVPPYHFFSVNFILPAGINTLVLKIIDAAAVHSSCSYSFAIDDIQFSAAGPKAHIAYDDGGSSDVVKSICAFDNKTISFTGNIDPGFINPLVQWQQTINNGVTWMDIPGATNYDYSKTFSVPDTFLFRLRAAEKGKIGNINCSVVSNTVRVEVDGGPPASDVTSNSPVCAGQDLMLNAAGGVSYIWSGPNGFYDDVSYAHIYHSTLADSGTYYVQIKSFGGCVATGSTHVTMIGTDVNVGPDQFICKGRSVQLNATGGISYLWSPASGLSNPGIENPVAIPEVTTTYSVTVTDRFGCSNSDSIKISLRNAVTIKAAISAPEFLCRLYDSAAFKDRSMGKIKSWNWNFGNGLSSSVQNPPTENYTIAGNITDYTVRLTVTDSSDCSDTAYHVMKVEDNCYIAVPSAFTPNGDGLNDYLYPLNAYKATGLLFKVFNRHGQLVFETGDWTKKWDGTFRGNPQTTNIFVWELTYTDANNKKIFFKRINITNTMKIFF